MRAIDDTFMLSNRVEMPCIGFGTWQAENGTVAYGAVLEALKAGYRHIDTAAYYANEQSVGRAVSDSGLPREEIFITTKLWKTDFRFDRAIASFKASLKALGTDYVDLYLLHWPEDAELTAEAWRALESLYADGRVRAIGVSNFLPHNLESLFAMAEVLPMVNQIEYHPGCMQRETVDFCRHNDIVIEAWGPLGKGRLLDHPTLVEIASHYGKSVAQLCIRWCIQNDVVPLPKSVTPARIISNTDVFDFVITNDDMAAINELSYYGVPRNAH